MKKALCEEKTEIWSVFTLNLPFNFPQAQFSLCAIINMSIFKFGALHLVSRHMFCILMLNLVWHVLMWYFNILYVNTNEIWALQQRRRLSLTNAFQSFPHTDLLYGFRRFETLHTIRHFCSQFSYLLSLFTFIVWKRTVIIKCANYAKFLVLCSWRNKNHTGLEWYKGE